MKKVFPLIVALEACQMWEYISYEYGYTLNWMAYSDWVRPYVYRVLLPFLARLIDYDNAVFWLAVLFVLSAIGFYCVMKWMSDDLVAFISFQALTILIIYQVKYYDYATAFFFALSLGLLNKGKHRVFLLLFPLATLNRETTFLLTIFYAVYFWGKMPLYKYLLSLSYQGVVYVAIKLFLQYTFANMGGDDIVIATELAVWHLVVLTGLFVALVWFSWGRASRFYRVAIVTIVPIQILLYLAAGSPFEVRVFAESTFLIVMIQSPFHFTTPSLPSLAVLEQKK